MNSNHGTNGPELRGAEHEGFMPHKFLTVRRGLRLQSSCHCLELDGVFRPHTIPTLCVTLGRCVGGPWCVIG